jgi:putative ABC transport system permease protein
MSPLWRLCFRELRNHWRFSLFFILNLASGLVGLILISSLLESVQASLDDRSQAMLGADLSVSIRRMLSASELRSLKQALPPESQSIEIADFFSMLESGGDSRLVQVRAVSDGYPFYGTLTTRESGVVGASGVSALEKSQSAWLDAELAQDFLLTPGKRFELGGVPFTAQEAVTEDATAGILTLAAAPRVLVAKRWFSPKYLDSRGTTLTYSWLIRLPAGINAEPVKKAVEKLIDDPSVRVRTHKDASEGLARLLKYFSDYLALVSLASLSLAALGVVYQFRRFFLSRSKSLAILLSLGATHGKALQLLAMELGVLSLAGSAIAIAGAGLALPFFAKTLGPLSVVPITPTLNWSVGLVAVASGTVLSFLLCLPQLWNLRKLKPVELFREQSRFTEGSSSSLVLYLPALVGFAALSIFYANSFWLAAYFIGGLAISAFFFTLIPWAALGTLERSVSSACFETRLALLHLRRNPASTLLICVCLGLVTLLATLLPQIRSSVRAEIETPEKGDRPSFFLLDIQPDQLGPLKSFLTKNGATFLRPSALIRGRLVSENGKQTQRQEKTGSFVTREDEQESAFRNRGFNLSYREGLSSSETLLSGQAFSGAWDAASGKIPEVSVEERFARRLGWKLGDVLTFDIEGEQVKGQIVNIRSVRWSSFQPNFFVVFQPGVLESFSAVFIGIVDKLAAEKARAITRAMAKEFPNISFIKVDQVLGRIYAVSEQMIAALLLTTLWVLLAAALTLYSIARYESYYRMSDMNLLKVVGAGQQTVRRIFVTESLTVSLLSATIGSLCGIGIAYVLMRWGLEGTFAWEPASIFVAIGGVTGWMYVQTLLTARRVWLTKPRELLVA